jgi:hypothetical protein
MVCLCPHSIADVESSWGDHAAPQMVMLQLTILLIFSIISGKDGQIPSDVLAQLRQPSFSAKYEIIKNAAPAFAFGDFNGDRLMDVIVPIRSINTNRTGLAVVLKGHRAPIVVGADVPFANRKALDPSVPLDEWKVVPKAKAMQLVGKNVVCRGDAIFAKENEAGSGLVCLTSHGFYWIQLGD